MSKLLSEILRGVEALDGVGRAGPWSPGPGGDPLIEGLAYDSREVKPGFLFFALSGLHVDGSRFIPQAMAAGARAVVCSGEGPRRPIQGEEGGVLVRVADSRLAMSPIAANFYGHPSRDLAVVGVTGTEGKSTTVYLIYQLLRLAGLGAGFFSTVMSDTGGGEAPNPEHQTTPEATAVQRMLAAMRDASLGYAVVESSSHGLSQRLNRLGDVDFDVGVMMNVTREHLEFHGTWEQYRHDKANLFRAIGRGVPKRSGSQETPRFGVVNEDDPSADYFRAATSFPVRSFSAAGAASADLRAEAVAVDPRGESFAIMQGGERYEARIELPGAFNVGNALAALLTVSVLCGAEVGELVPLLPRLRPVRGRMTAVDKGQSFEVIVDYAHTPSSFLAVFPSLRKRIEGRMICVFGSAGERDTEKRARQGRIAADWFDIVILADEDPRGEEPMALLEEIASGCPELRRGERLHLIPDRKTAIRKAFSLAGAGDLVALLGKGHENSIIYAKGGVPYDEIGEAERALAELGYAESRCDSATELRSAQKDRG
jgi:UDP-N-acetylmuramoyl-L-alanyl-D-glutamate--2,6-diaminopimelate ligase